MNNRLYSKISSAFIMIAKHVDIKTWRKSRSISITISLSIMSFFINQWLCIFYLFTRLLFLIFLFIIHKAVIADFYFLQTQRSHLIYHFCFHKSFVFEFLMISSESKIMNRRNTKDSDFSDLNEKRKKNLLWQQKTRKTFSFTWFDFGLFAEDLFLTILSHEKKASTKTPKNDHLKKKRKVFKSASIIVDFELFQKKAQSNSQNSKKNSTSSSKSNFTTTSTTPQFRFKEFINFIFSFSIHSSFITSADRMIALQTYFDMKLNTEPSTTSEKKISKASNEETQKIRSSKIKNKQRADEFFIVSSNVFFEEGIHLKNLSKNARFRLMTKTRTSFDFISAEDEPKIIELNDEKLNTKTTIKHFHFWVRFLVKSNAEPLNLDSRSKKPVRMKIKTEMIKIFVDYANDKIKNKIYRKSKIYVMLTEKQIYLKIFDKKEIISKLKPSAYHFIDVLESVIAEDKIWWIKQFVIKEARNETAFETVEKHKDHKEKAHKLWKRQCFEYWRNTLLWKFKVIHQCWRKKSIVFFIEKSKTKILKAANLFYINYSKNYSVIIRYL